MKTVGALRLKRLFAKMAEPEKRPIFITSIEPKGDVSLPEQVPENIADQLNVIRMKTDLMEWVRRTLLPPAFPPSQISATPSVRWVY